MIDSFYTSKELATRLVNHIRKRDFTDVVDFCVGDGELIRAAQSLWPNISCYGTDVSDLAIKQVKKKHTDWQIGKCNLLNPSSINSCHVIKKKKDGFDLILLNPPFSCKGGTIHEVIIDNKVFRVSTSMKFLTESLKFLSNKGCLLSIMPISVCYSQKDNEIRNFLIKNYNLNILEIPDGKFFKNCSPNIVLISINLNTISLDAIKNNLSFGFSNYQIIRGKLSVNKAKYCKNGLTFIHSTNLKNNSLENVRQNVKKTSSVITGPAVLIPRVGKPSVKKVCVITENSQFALSDCILAIKVNSEREAQDIYTKLIGNFELLENQYIGTGAKFITVERLNNLLK